MGKHKFMNGNIRLEFDETFSGDPCIKVMDLGMENREGTIFIPYGQDIPRIVLGCFDGTEYEAVRAINKKYRRARKDIREHYIRSVRFGFFVFRNLNDETNAMRKAIARKKHKRRK